jgi:hypothetical protein
VLVAGCGGATAAPKLPADVGAALVRQTAVVEDALNAGDEATAQTQAAALVQAIDQAIAAGRVPAALADDLRAGAERLLALVSATQEEPPPPEEDNEDSGKGKKKGHDKNGGENTPTATAPPPPPPPPPATTDTTPTTTGTGL